MIPRIKVGKGVTGAVRYVLSEGKDRTGHYRTEPKGEASRVAWISGFNLGFEVETAADADLARRVMEFDAFNQASRTKPCEKDCVHLSLGWRPGEQPTREQMEQAARAALAALGMANAKAIIVAHTDEPYAHLHIVASKIDPDTGRAYDLKGDQLKLSRWAQAYEVDHSGGIVCIRRAEANQLRDAIERRDAVAVLALMMQQRATLKPAELDRALAKQIRKPLQRAQFANRVLALPEVVRLAERPGAPVTRYTTRAILQAEGQVLLSARALHEARRFRVSWQTAMGIERGPDFRSMSREQKNALARAIGGEGLALIDGQAGTGKSFTMAAIRQAYEAEGFAVIGLAPTNAVAQDMRGSGFAHADTIHAELFRLNNNRAAPWTARTVLMVDEVAMIDTLLMAQLARRAEEAGAKLILIGDDRQLSSIDRGGMFGALKDAHGAAALTQVRRQHKQDDRRAAELMAEGNFSAALAIYDDKKAIHWQHNQEAARAALVEQWAKDSAADPSRARFVFAYTNADVDQLNGDLRKVRLERGELGQGQRFATKHGPAEFADGDRVQLTGTDKKAGLVNGAAGTIESINGRSITVKLDGRPGAVVTINADQFKDFRHGYAGTIYKGQGRTLDETYLYHSEHWRASSGYVALTRHRHKVDIFTARDVVEDLPQLARQMARVDDRRAASRFHQPDGALEIERVPTASLPKVEFQKRDAAAPVPAAPVASRPLDWAQSPGMVAQQESALRAAKAAERAQVEAFGPVAPQAKPRVRVPANSNPVPRPAPVTPEAVRQAEAAQPGAARQRPTPPTPQAVPYAPVYPTLPRYAPAAPAVVAAQESGKAIAAPVPPAPARQETAKSAPYAPVFPTLPSYAPTAPAARRVADKAAPAPVTLDRAAPTPTAAPQAASARPQQVSQPQAGPYAPIHPTLPKAASVIPAARQEVTKPAHASVLPGPIHPTLPRSAPTAPAARQVVGKPIPTPLPLTPAAPVQTARRAAPAAAPRSVTPPAAPKTAIATPQEVRRPIPAPTAAPAPVAPPAARQEARKPEAGPTPPAAPAPVQRPAAAASAATAQPTPAAPVPARQPFALSSSYSQTMTAAEVFGRFNDPAARARYHQQEEQRSAQKTVRLDASAEAQPGRAAKPFTPAVQPPEKTAAQKRFEEITAGFTRESIERANAKDQTTGRGGRGGRRR